MALNQGEREEFIREASKLNGDILALIGLAAIGAGVTQLVLGAHGIEVKAKKLFDDFLADAIDNP